MNIGDIERGLFRLFPACDAEAWDHVGLSVGDRRAEFSRALVALDVTPDTISSAVANSANLLVTHHPVYIKAPAFFSPGPSVRTPQASAAVFDAIRNGVSIISMHTNLDRSVEARRRLCSMLGLDLKGSLENPDEPLEAGLGALSDTAGIRLDDLARRAAEAFSTIPRVWGDPALCVRRVAICSGSLGDFGELALTHHADAVICGEAGYHVCQDLACRGCGVILLGHDASELPFRGVLSEALETLGVSNDDIFQSDERRGWRVLGEDGCS